MCVYVRHLIPHKVAATIIVISVLYQSLDITLAIIYPPVYFFYIALSARAITDFGLDAFTTVK